MSTVSTIIARLLATTAEQAIRNAVPESVGIGKPFYFVVSFNGRSIPFEGRIDKVPTAAEQRRGILSSVHLSTIRKGVLMKGDAPQPLIFGYVLNGKNQLLDSGLPRVATKEDLAIFRKHFPRSVLRSLTE